jgi:hypothetical protein
MPVVRVIRFLLVPAALVAALELLRLSRISLEQAFHTGFGEGLMMAWVLLFVVGLPLLLLGGSAAAALGRRRMRRQIVPLLGVKIP